MNKIEIRVSLKESMRVIVRRSESKSACYSESESESESEK